MARSDAKVEYVFQKIQQLITLNINTGVMPVPTEIISRVFADLGSGMLKYTFNPENFETRKKTKGKKEIKIPILYNKHGCKVMQTDNNKVFKTARVDREQLRMEQPYLHLEPESMTLKGHSIQLANEGLILSLYDFIDYAYTSNQKEGQTPMLQHHNSKEEQKQ